MSGHRRYICLYLYSLTYVREKRFWREILCIQHTWMPRDITTIILIYSPCHCVSMDDWRNTRVQCNVRNTHWDTAMVLSTRYISNVCHLTITGGLLFLQFTRWYLVTHMYVIELNWVVSGSSNPLGGLVRERRNSSALTVELLRLSCTNPSTCGLLGDKPSPEPILTHHQVGP